MELNRKELKKIIYGFNTIASRMMRASWDEYNMILNKFLTYIDKNEIILQYINSGYDRDFDVEREYKEVIDSRGRLVFYFGPTQEQESYQIYKVLKYILKSDSNIHFDMRCQYRGSTYQDIVKEFNNRIVLVLINNIEEYFTRVGIDMGMDENVIFNVSGGQVNVASGNATINATQSMGIDTKELNEIIKTIKSNLSELSQEEKETVIDSIEMIQEEVLKPEPKTKIISNGIKLLAPIITIANGIPILVNNLQKFISIVSTFIHK